MSIHQRCIAVLMTASIVLVFHASLTPAHSPHDIVQSLAVATGDDQVQDIFAIVQKKLRKSTA